MSPAVAARFPWYIKIFHGRQGARSLHFLGLCSFIAFFIGHLTIVALHGFRMGLAAIVLGQTRNPHLTLAFVIWLAGLTGEFALNLPLAIDHVLRQVLRRERQRGGGGDVHRNLSSERTQFCLIGGRLQPN